jgi:hypothetical protein
MATAKNFYKLWNKQTYDTHPPLYAWLIKYLKFGVMVSFLCSVGLFYVSSLLYSALGLNPYQKTIALTFLAFNYTLIYYSNRVFRYQLIALLGTLTIYLLVNHSYFAAGLSWGLLGLTCTFAGLRGFFIWMMFPNWVTLVTFLVVYSSWLIDKIWIYKNYEYYPSGIDGKIEKVDKFTLKQLISPLYFSWNHAYYGKKELAYVWPTKLGGVFGFYPPLGFLMPVMLFFVIKGALISPLWVSIIIICLLYPSLLKRFLPRNSIIAIPLLGFLLAKGLPQLSIQALNFAILVIGIGFLSQMRATLLTNPKIKALETSKYLNSLPLNGLLVEGLIAYPIAYNSSKRVVVLPHNPDPIDARSQTRMSIGQFDLNYAVISEMWKIEEHLGYPAVNFVKKHFTLIKTIEEDGDIYRIYEIPSYIPK